MQNENDDILKYFDWDYQIATCESKQELTQFQWNLAAEAFRFLRKQLGIDYPRNVFESKTDFIYLFLNTAPWTRSWFTWLADSIKKLRGSKNFNKVLQKLSSNKNDEYNEAITLLEFGNKFKSSGFAVDFEIEISNGKNLNKNSDLCLTNVKTNENIFVEITRLTLSPEQLKYEKLFQEITRMTYSKGIHLNYSGSLFKEVSDERLTEIKERIKSITESLIVNPGIEFCIIDDVIELAISTSIDKSLLSSWCIEKGYSIDTFSFPQQDPFRRIKAKIKHKSSQSSSTSPNILIIKNDDFSSFQKPEKFIHELEETVFKCQDLLAVMIVSHEFGGKIKEGQTFGMHSFTSKTERYALTSNNLILVNKYYLNNKITIHSLTRIIEAFN